jgi:hypothetical protein
MVDSADRRSRPTRLSRVPTARWLAEYRAAWLRGDVIAGVTLAAYAIPSGIANRWLSKARPGRARRVLQAFARTQGAGSSDWP